MTIEEAYAIVDDAYSRIVNKLAIDVFKRARNDTKKVAREYDDTESYQYGDVVSKDGALAIFTDKLDVRKFYKNSLSYLSTYTIDFESGIRTLVFSNGQSIPNDSPYVTDSNVFTFKLYIQGSIVSLLSVSSPSLSNIKAEVSDITDEYIEITVSDIPDEDISLDIGIIKFKEEVLP